MNNKRLTTEEFIEKSKMIYGNLYDYSKVIYVNTGTKVIIICPLHGDFTKSPDNHLRGQKCPKCALIKRALIRSLSVKEFVNRAKKIHENRYGYEKTDYKNYNEKVIIICPIHGEFLQSPDAHLKGEGCPKCSYSRGELKISSWLNENKIEYIDQKKFDNCVNPKTKKKLEYDFYIPSKNLLIEYDGEQHFKAITSRNYKMTDDDLADQKYRDEIKTEYARKTDMELLRIKYTQFNHIDQILESVLRA